MMCDGLSYQCSERSCLILDSLLALRYLRVSRDRNSFYLALTKADLANFPLMPKNDYKWLADYAWLERNNSQFSVEPK